MVTVVLRLPAAYRSGTGSGKEEEEERVKGLGGVGDVGGMSLGENCSSD